MTPLTVLLQGAALASSLFHVLLDTRVGLFGSGTAMTVGEGFALMSLAAVSGWWIAPIFAGARGSRGALLALVILASVWAALANGAIGLAFCFVPCQGAAPFGDISHLGSLVLGTAAAIATWRAYRAASGPADPQFVLTALVLIALAFVLQGTNVTLP